MIQPVICTPHVHVALDSVDVVVFWRYSGLSVLLQVLGLAQLEIFAVEKEPALPGVIGLWPM